MIPVFQSILTEIINDLLTPQDINDFNITEIVDENGVFYENFSFMNFYKYIAFKGLHQSTTYINSINNVPSERKKYELYQHLLLER